MKQRREDMKPFTTENTEKKDFRFVSAWMHKMTSAMRGATEKEEKGPFRKLFMLRYFLSALCG